MRLPTRDQLDELSRADLLALVKELIELILIVQRWEAENRELKAALAKGRPPPATSRNSSQPPSRDEERNLPAAKKQKKWGPPFGHARKTRSLVDQPGRSIEAPVEQCPHCQAELRGGAPRAVVRHHLTELPPITPAVIETRQHEGVCPRCQQLTRGRVPEELDPGRSFGPRREAKAVYLKHEQPLSSERLTHLCHALFGVEGSDGGAAAILRRAGAAAPPVAAALGAQVSQRTVSGSAETSARVAGCTWGHGGFLSAVGVYDLSRPSRAAKVRAAVRGEQRAQCWVCDGCSAQLQAPAAPLQLCLAPQLRDGHRWSEPRPRVR
jgi:transposase